MCYNNYVKINLKVCLVVNPFFTHSHLFRAGMDNYTKGGNELEEVSREMIPIKGLSGSCIWMRVKAGSKVKNLSTVAMRALRDNGEVIFSGHGQALNKVIACAEIVKRNAVIEPEEKIFQYNKVNYLKVNVI